MRKIGDFLEIEKQFWIFFWKIFFSLEIFELRFDDNKFHKIIKNELFLVKNLNFKRSYVKTSWSESKLIARSTAQTFVLKINATI